MIPTTDHDQGPPPLAVGNVDHLARVLLDGHRWALLPPGDPIAAYLLDGEGSSNEAE